MWDNHPYAMTETELAARKTCRREHLSHLEDAGLLDVMLDETGPGVYARRRFYRLTDEGRRIARSGLGLPQ